MQNAGLLRDWCDSFGFPGFHLTLQEVSESFLGDWNCHEAL